MKKANQSIGIKKRSLWAAALLSAVALAISGCGASGGAAPVSNIKVSSIKTEPVTKRTISSPIEQVADAKAGTAISVLPKASGTVTEVRKKKGERVEQGEILFVIDKANATSTLRKSELSVQSAQLALKNAKDDKVNNRQDYVDAVSKAETSYKTAQQDYNKMRNDFDAGNATQRQLDQSKDSLDTAKLNLDAAKNKLAVFDKTDSVTSAQIQLDTAQQALEDAKRTLEDLDVKAPGSGILTDFDVIVGQTVSTSASVGQIQKIDPITISTELAESNYQLVKGKTELVYYSPDTPDQKNKAPVSYLAPIMSATNKTYTLELEVPNKDGQLQPGKRYMVQLTTEAEEKVATVSSLAVIREDSDFYVFVKSGDQYQKRKVKLGRINGEYQEVLDGVKEGEEVVVSGQNTLKDGQKVDSAAGASSSPTSPTSSASPAATANK